MFTTTLLLVAALIAAAVALLAINLIVRKHGTFRSHDIGASDAMRQRGIHCYRTQDRLAQADQNSLRDMMQAPDEAPNE